MVGIDAALSGATELALGNVVGSNIANVLLVLGIPALCYPFVCDDSEIRYGLFFMMLATVLFIGLSFFGPLDIWQGTLMLSLLLIFLVYSVRRARNNSAVLKHESDYAERALGDLNPGLVKQISLSNTMIMIVLGLAGLIFGAHILVDGAIIIARTLGVSEAVIGLTIVAIGTSLPELVASIMAVRNNHGDVAMGNIIGSNLFNILAIMGITSLISPIAIPAVFFQVDFPILMASSLILIPIAMGKIKINRPTGGVFSVIYIGYLLYLGVQSNLIG